MQTASETKLTNPQWAVLRRACETGDIARLEAIYEGGNKSTLDALERRGLLVSRQVANGRFWFPTDAGFAAIAKAEAA